MTMLSAGIINDVAPLKDGLQAYYTMDGSDVSSGTLSDASGNGHDANIVGANVGAQGVVNEAFSFDGVDDYVKSQFKTSNGSQTTACWLRINTTNTGRNYTNSVGNTGTEIYHIDNEGLTGSGLGSSFQHPISANTWVHAANIYDDSAGESIFYVNGTAVKTASGTLDTSSTNGLKIGGNVGGTNQWGGEVDEVRVYDRALSSEEISTLYQQ